MARKIECNFLVRPLETIHFGSPRSFSAGENHLAHSEFPPSQFAFQGLVRTQFLRSVTPTLDLDDWSRQARAARAALVGGPDSFPQGWQLRGPFPAKSLPAEDDLRGPQIAPWVPSPRFLLRLPHRRRPGMARPVASSHPALQDLDHSTILVGLPQEDASGPLGGWIGPENLYYALTGRGEWNPDQYCEPLPPFVARERRPGLAVDRETATARHSMLYFLSALRFESECGLFGSFHGELDETIAPSALHLGGSTAGRKGRPVAFEKVEELHPFWSHLRKGEHLPREVAETDAFWLALLTPARIKAPDAPGIIPPLPPGVSFHIRVALTGSPTTIGGYSMASGESRANRAFTPPGSAWLFSLAGGDSGSRAEALRQLNDVHALGDPNEAPFGFGHCMVGLAPAVEEEAS